MTTLKSIALELLQKYEETQTSLIWEYSGDIDKSMENLDAEVAKYRDLIDKYAGQEPCRDMEEIREVMDCDVDAETKCKMISNILTDKPHYFVGQEPCRVKNELKVELNELEPCDDVVSRDMALEKMADYVASGYADSVEDFEEYSRIICQLPTVRPQEPILEHWQELKETIIEMRDNDGTGTQQEVCKFLANYMGVLEKQFEPQESEE